MLLFDAKLTKSNNFNGCQMSNKINLLRSSESLANSILIEIKQQTTREIKQYSFKTFGTWNNVWLFCEWCSCKYERAQSMIDVVGNREILFIPVGFHHHDECLTLNQAIPIEKYPSSNYNAVNICIYFVCCFSVYFDPMIQYSLLTC